MSNDFSIFGYGQGGIPGEVELWLSRDGAVEEAAQEIINIWQAWAESTEAVGSRRLNDSQATECATMAYLLLAWHSKHDKPLPPIVLEAIAHILGQVGTRSGQPTPSKKVLERFGIPDVKMIDKFLQAALLDGEADATGKPLSQNALHRATGVSRQTLRVWRKMPAYIRRREMAAMAAKAALIHAKWNPKLNGGDPPTDRQAD